MPISVPVISAMMPLAVSWGVQPIRVQAPPYMAAQAMGRHRSLRFMRGSVRQTLSMTGKKAAMTAVLAKNMASTPVTTLPTSRRMT